jgi:hypothetical protein
VKSTLKRELKGREIARMEGYELNAGSVGVIQGPIVCSCLTAATLFAAGKVAKDFGPVLGLRPISMRVDVRSPDEPERLVAG